ncbi:MAG: hypothetical protein K2O70_05985, partial [Desulfovibrionaceae bacterium]|nr:hypothetical protein [Desulfovibrionaceae bacterium]
MPDDASLDIARKINDAFAARTPVTLFLGKNGRAEMEAAARPWSFVATTMRDENLLRDFDIDGKRHTIPILDEVKMLEKGRLGMREMNLAFLFGTGEVVPLSRLERRKRDQGAARMLGVLSEMLKENYGYLVIAGYDPDSEDELAIDNLYDALADIRKGSVLMFGVKDSFWEIDSFTDLVASGIVLATKESLADALAESGTGEIGEFEEIPESGEIFYINNKRVSLPSKKLFDTRGFATLLCEREMGDLSVPSHMKRDYFNSFLRNSAARPIWYGYENGFNLERVFEKKLYDETKNALKLQREGGESPVLLSGQTSSGTSMA